KADSIYKHYLPYIENSGDTAKWVHTLSALGNIASMQGKVSAALVFYYKAREIEKNRNPENYNGILVNMAQAYSKIGQFDRALANLMETLEYFEKTNNKNLLGIINNNIGELYRENLNNTRMALLHYRKAIFYSKAAANSYQLAKNYNNLGILFDEEGNKDSALFYLH